MCVSERDFARTLDTRLGKALMENCKILQADVRKKVTDHEQRDHLLALLAGYEQNLEKIIVALIDLELTTAHSTLQFDRLMPKLKANMDLLDRETALTTDRLNDLRRA